MSRPQVALLIAALSSLTSAQSAPTPVADPVLVPEAHVTPSPVRRDSSTIRLEERDIISDLNGDVHSILNGLGSAVPSYVASGIPDFFQNFPTGSQVASSLGVDSTAAAALPTEVLNIPPYANWTGTDWNVRLHGNVYKTPDISNQTLDRLTNAFLPNVDVDQLPTDQAAQARNVTREIFVLQQGNVRPGPFSLDPAPMAGTDGTAGGGGAVTAAGGSQTVNFPYNTTVEGDYDAFVKIALQGLERGNETEQIQRLNVYTSGTDTGNATAYLVPPGPGLTVVSDIDDILRVTKIYEPEEGLLNSFARPYTPWMNMPEIYRNWSSSLTLGGNATHFHYLTTLPEQVTRNYMQFIYSTYPGGSFDTRPLNFSNIPETLSVREYLLEKIFATFPRRRFILVGDTSNSDIMRDYPGLAHRFPDQVQCIFLRNTTNTDPGDKFPYNTEGFKGLPQEKYMFFVVPDDLKHLDIANGQCYNNSIKQNITYGEQGLPLGINLGNGQNSSSGGSPSSSPSPSGGGSDNSNGTNGSSEAPHGVTEVKASMMALVGAFTAAWLLL